MAAEILCPLCQPVGCEGQEKKATAEKYFDGGILVECSDCGRYRLKSPAAFGRVALASVSDEKLEIIRRVIRVESRFDMVTLISSKTLMDDDV